MELTNKRKDSLKIFFLSFLIVFVRFILITPIDLLGIDSDMLETGIKLKFAVYTALLFTLSVVISAGAAKFYHDSKSSFIIYPLIFIIADPIFCLSVGDCLILTVSCVAIMLYLLLMSPKSRTFGCICLPLFALVCTALSKGFVFSIVPLFVLVCTLLIIEGKQALSKNIGIPVIVCTIVFAVIGVLLNINISGSEVLASFYKFISNMLNAYSEIYRKKSVILILLSAIPSVIFGAIVLSCSSKVKKKNDHSYAVYNVTGVALLICVAGAMFFQSEAFLSLGVIVTVSIMTLLLTGNASVEASLARIDAFVKKNVALCFGVAIIVEIICYISMYRYLSAKRLLDYVLEII